MSGARRAVSVSDSRFADSASAVDVFARTAPLQGTLSFGGGWIELRVFIPDHADAQAVVAEILFCGHRVKVAIAVEVDQFDAVEFAAVGPGYLVLDPDCIVLRDTPVPEELKKFVSNPLQDREIRVEEFGLSNEESDCWLRLVWMSGGMFILSEDIAGISTGKWSLLEEMLEPNLQPVCWVDDYRNPELGLLKTTSGPWMVGLFNLSDQPVDLSFDAEELGLPPVWNFSERMSGETFSGQGHEVCFPPLPPHAGRVWVLQYQK